MPTFSAVGANSDSGAASTHSRETDTANPSHQSSEPHNHKTNHHLKRAWSTRVLEFQFVLPRTPPVQVPLWQTLAFAAIAPSLASIMTNPFEVAKVRLQLQRSSMHKGIFSQVPETFVCLQRTWQLEGIRGLQRGLSLVLWQNSARNVVRLGLYEQVMGILHPKSRNTFTTKSQSAQKSDSSPPLWKRVVGGAICGAMGAVSGNPFDIIKTRWQAQGKAAEAQTVHQYKGTMHAFQTVLRQEGLRGLYVGVLNNMLLNAIGGAAQLATMYALKDHLLSRQWEDSFGLDLACSIASAAVTVLAINPVDVVRTRSYSVGKCSNGRYPFMFTTAKEIFRNEGPRSFFRGAGASFMFVVPKYALTFVILGRLHVFAKAREEERAETASLRKAFKAVDVNCDGVLNPAELRLALKTDLPHTLLYPVTSMSSSKNYVLDNSGKRSSNLRKARSRQSEDMYRRASKPAVSIARRRSDELIERSRRQRDIEVEQEVQRMLLQGDGQMKDAITFEDFAEIGKALRIVLRLKELWRAFDSLDHDRDGRVEVAKIKRALTIAAEEAAEADADDAEEEQAGLMKGASWFKTENEEVIRKRQVEAARRIIDKSCTPDAAGTVGFDDFLLIYNKLRDKKLSNVVWLWTKGGPTL